MEEKNTVYEFDLETTEKENKETKEKFFAYRAYSEKQKVWINLKFTRDVPQESLPTRNGKLFVKFGKINLNLHGKFPVFWVSEIEKFEEFTGTSQDLSKYF